MDSYVYGGMERCLKNIDASSLARKSDKEFFEYMASKYTTLCLRDLPRPWFKIIFDQTASGDDVGKERLLSDIIARNLHEALQQESRLICPQPMKNIWSWARCVPDPRSTRVVVLASSPYHEVIRLQDDNKNGNKNFNRETPITMADGLAFSVNPEYEKLAKSLPLPLVNIMKLADPSFTIRQFDDTRFRGDLTMWTEAGVVLLNTALTTVQDTVNAHADIGWHRITDRVIEWLGRKCNTETETRIFMLWGKECKNKLELIDTSSHVCLINCHPTNERDWFEKNDFRETDLLLKTLGHPGVVWSCRRRLPQRTKGPTARRIESEAELSSGANQTTNGSTPTDLNIVPAEEQEFNRTPLYHQGESLPFVLIGSGSSVENNDRSDSTAYVLNAPKCIRL